MLARLKKKKNRTLRLAGFLFGFCFERERGWDFFYKVALHCRNTMLTNCMFRKEMVVDEGITDYKAEHWLIKERYA